MDDNRQPRFNPSTVIILLSSFISALFLRLVHYKEFITPERIMLAGTDSYDHMRRAALMLHNFPHIPLYNYYQGYPAGTRLVLPFLHDFMYAFIAWATGLGSPSERTALTVWAIAPAVVGSLSVFAAYCLARRIVKGRVAAAIGAAVFGVLPGYLFASFTGQMDNNVIEPIVAALYFAALLSTLDTGTSADIRAEHRRQYSTALTASFLGLVALFMWRGSSLLWVTGFCVIAISFFLQLRLRNNTERAKGMLSAGAVIFTLQGLVMLFLALSGLLAVEKTIMFNELSSFHAILGLGIGSGFILAFLIIGRHPDYLRNPFITAITFTAPFIVMIAVVPGLMDEIMHSASMMGKGQRWFIDNVENAPILYLAGSFDPWFPTTNLTAMFWLVPPAVIWLATDVIRSKDRVPAESVFMVVYLTVMYIFTLSHQRYQNMLALGIALLFAIALDRLVLAPGRSRLVRTVVAAGLVIAFMPAAKPLYLFASGTQLVTEGQIEAMEAMEWLRDNTPPTRHYNEPWDTMEMPEYGVLASWAYGSRIEAVAQRPAVATNFGEETHGFDDFLDFFLSDNESDALDVLDRNRVRYVMVTNITRSLKNYALIRGLAPDTYISLKQDREGDTYWAPKASYFRLVSTSLLINDGIPIRGMNIPLPRLHRFRLLYESRGGMNTANLPHEVKGIKIFEYVKGARLTVKTAPDTVVELSLDIKTNRERLSEYYDASIAGKDGIAGFILPYSTEHITNSTSALGPYRIIVEGKQPVELSVTEGMVINGDLLTLNM